MRRSYLLVLIPFAFLPFWFLGCTPPPNFWSEAKPGQKKILVSFPPLYAITHAVAGDDGYVLCMLSTQGPHGYNYSTHDLLKVKHADLFIFNGLTLDDNFVDRLLTNHRNASLITLNVGEVMEKKKLLLPGAHDDEPEGAKEEGHGHDHKHGKHDPHMWLGPKQAIAMTKIIASKLSEIDPNHGKNYEKRADAFIEELKKLEAYGKAALKGKKIKMVTMHEAFSYFADAFDVEIVGAIQKLPGSDPDSASRAKLVKLCKEKKVSLIAVETQYSHAQAESLQRTLKKDGVDVTIVTLDPLETADIADGKKYNPDPGYYLKTMRANIDALVKAAP